MKRIQIGDQPFPGLGRTLRITADGIRYRLFRSSVTLAVIAVAVAFLMNVLGESLIRRAVARDARGRAEDLRLAHRWAARLSAPPGVEGVLRELAAARPGSATAAELERFGAPTAEEASSLRGAAVQSCRYLDFFSGLDYARRRRLVGAAEGAGILDFVASPDGCASFLDMLRQTRSVRFPDPPPVVGRFGGRWRIARAQVERIASGWAAAAAEAGRAAGGRGLMEALASGDAAFGEAVRRAGFAAFDARVTAPRVAAQAREALDTLLVEAALERRPARQAVARHYNILPGDVGVERLWRYLAEPANAAAFLDAARGADPALDRMPPARLASLAAGWREAGRLERAARLTAGTEGGWMNLGPRMAWLLAVSMLVCGIGIANAMLMTVTERFRQIATLKCLGALDGFIMLMFVLESSLLGVAGGLVGGALGGALGVARMRAAFGGSFAGCVPWGGLAVGLLLAVLCGVALAAVASVYPAFRAARLAPMEAMRVE